MSKRSISMKVKDFIRLGIPIDICENVFGVVLPAPHRLELTDEGKKQFKNLLNSKIHIDPDSNIATLKIKGLSYSKNIVRQSEAVTFFDTAIGWGLDIDYNKWFVKE